MCYIFVSNVLGKDFQNREREREREMEREREREIERIAFNTKGYFIVLLPSRSNVTIAQRFHSRPQATLVLLCKQKVRNGPKH